VYYTQRSAPQRQQRKRYTRNQIAVERDGKSSHYRPAGGEGATTRGTVRDALPLIRKTRAVHPVGYSMDKAYDSEEIRRVVHEDVRAACMIPLKEGAKRGTYRLAMREEFDEELYHRRNLVETVFSVEWRSGC
jgi:hypothetical protein